MNGKRCNVFVDVTVFIHIRVSSSSCPEHPAHVSRLVVGIFLPQSGAN